MSWFIANCLLIGEKGRECHVMSLLKMKISWTQSNKNMYLLKPFFREKNIRYNAGPSILDSPQVSTEHLEQCDCRMIHNTWLSSTDFVNKINTLRYDYDYIWIDGA